MKVKNVLAFLSFTLCLTLTLSAQEENLRERDVPEGARNALASSYPNAKVRNWDREIKDGKVVYEAEGVTDGKIIRNIMYMADGAFVQMEETMPIADVPVAVSGGVTSQYPRAAIQSAIRLTHGDIVEYVLKLKNAPVKTVVLDKDGKITRTK
jgi:hypothetical protein